MNKIALIVVDAWENPTEEELYQAQINERGAFYQSLNDSFNDFLSSVVHYESLKDNIDVYHSPDMFYRLPDMSCNSKVRKISKKFYKYNTKFKIINNITDIPADYDYYLFCGYTYHNCIFRKIIFLSTLVNLSKIGIVFNLTMTEQEIDIDEMTFDLLDKFECVKENAFSSGYNVDHLNIESFNGISNWYWTHNGYRLIDVTCL